MQDAEEIFSKSLDVLGKLLDKDKAEAEAETAKANKAEPPAEAVTPNQPVEIEAHEVEPSEPWYHPHHWMHHAPTIVVAALGLVGMIVVAKFNNRRRK